MKDDWMISVLADLRKFANDNSMAKLVKQLDDTIHVAALEVVPKVEKTQVSDTRSGDGANLTRAVFVV